MTKKPTNDTRSSERRERDPQAKPKSQPGDGSAGTYKMRSAASRRAEARARAAYRGAAPGMEGPAAEPEPRIAVRDVGIRPHYDILDEGAAERERQRKKKAQELEQDLIIQLLHNPTKQVPVEVLQAQYSYVAADIRNMALLAAGLFALLIVLALVLPH
ncbi:MAG: hypothetical protein IPK19_15380 [Chloroflexi bacterium]|nr:hypothetical protein [Chloroflexota bacterium]